MHREQHPLVVFSKSYCPVSCASKTKPLSCARETSAVLSSIIGFIASSRSPLQYSKKAKALLTSLGAHYTVYEVDQRAQDAGPLQEALAAISGHHTFPAVFARGRLLGGSDELARLDKLNVLRGVLSGAGAL